MSLPKGGGALKGIGEKLAANPVTGTASMAVPIATSAGRSGFGPQLSLSYDSGSGNGPFGFGWSLGLPQVARKTEKGLPTYDDAAESDVFVLSGSEDLVPLLNPDGSRFEDSASALGFRIQRYRPRVEGLFARIERWTRRSDGDVHWRSISGDNVLTMYGKDTNSRITDPADPARIFSWLVCETRDDKGNAVIYEYRPEDGTGVDLSRAHELNRGEPNAPRRTANRYIKRIRYGNRLPLVDGAGRRPHFISEDDIGRAEWMFEVVFDYGEHDKDAPGPNDEGPWTYRDDAFSTHRSGFEVRTCRLCDRVLMFHHFEDEVGVGRDCLVRSTDFTYSHEENPNDARNPVYTFLLSVTHSGFKRQADGYLKRSLPPVEFEYSKPLVQDLVEDVSADSLENLPMGLDGAVYQWTDFHGEGITGILTEQGGVWWYKRNLSPITLKSTNGRARVEAKFAPVELVSARPNVTLSGGRAQFMDLAGDGQPDIVVLDGPLSGLYEHDGDEGWHDFRPLSSNLNQDLRDPNLRFVDLDGDGHVDALVTEEDAFIWHQSLAEEGLGPGRRVKTFLDEEKGPRLVFADPKESIYLADMSGDGLTDLVRIRNDEVCYWPNIGYGHFGSKVTMDHAPHFDNLDQFQQNRVRLADIDGTGTIDILYLHRDGVRLYFNQSGNSWSPAQSLNAFPHIDELTSVSTLDLLGTGTACLVWSSALPSDVGRQMRYVNLMGDRKPHLLVAVRNNLGAETHIHYAPSTKFYVQDKFDGKPWITRLPFPVHVVERVETYDHISRNRFVTRYAYHHGFFDGEEREFHGFGMVEQFDTEEMGALTAGGELPVGDNIQDASHVPPVLTKTWFHTGAFLKNHAVSRQFEREYYREPGISDDDFQAQLLPDTSSPPGLSTEESREACRALKGSLLRQEVYALDGTGKERHPYSTSEHDYTIKVLQRRGRNRHAVFFVHPREAIEHHYERSFPADPRVAHTLTLEVDAFGNVLKQASVGYGRRETLTGVDQQGEASRIPNPGLAQLDPVDRQKQTSALITYTESAVTNDIDDGLDYHTPLPCESSTYEIIGRLLPERRGRFTFGELLGVGQTAVAIAYEQVPTPGLIQKRLIEQDRMYFQRNDLSGRLPLGQLQSLALPFESYRLALTPGLVVQAFGGRVDNAMLENEGRYVHIEGDEDWWLPSGQVFYSPDPTHTPAQELEFARRHFFLPHRFRDPFHTSAVSTESFVAYDKYDLLIQEIQDALDNRVTVGERNVNPTLPLARSGQDYRVLQPALVMDPNRNRSEVVFDALGMVVGTAVMGKPEDVPVPGDILAGFPANLTQIEIDQVLEDPKGPLATALLASATTRIVYDLTAYLREPDAAKKRPVVAATFARETHASDPVPAGGLRVQLGFSYSDGFGREIQQKIQAEPGPVPRRDANGQVIVDANGQPVMTIDNAPQRWAGSGWTVFNNKGKPVRQYEPFFTDTHRFEFDVRIGVSPVIFYDPAERVVATLHPNHTWEKVTFDPWRQATWDVNDTLSVADPKTDPDMGAFFSRLPEAEYLPTWYALRTDPASAAAASRLWPNIETRNAERRAAEKAAIYASSPNVAHADALGRSLLTVAHNKFKYSDRPEAEAFYETRVVLDIEGNAREVVDAKGRVVMRYDYDMLGNRVHQASMEAGERWMLNDVASQPIRAWDSRGRAFHTEYDKLRRPVTSFVSGVDPNDAQRKILFERSVFGEFHPQAVSLNLRTAVLMQLDSAGVVMNTGRNPATNQEEAYDFKGNLLRSSRRIAGQYKERTDWSALDPLLQADALNLAAIEAQLLPLVEADPFSGSTSYDALNRPITLTTPDGSITRRTYNEANLLDRVGATLRGAGAPTVFVENIDYNAKGQRERIRYGNGAVTRYSYDPQTFRLVRLRTTRNGGTEVLQDLHYAYDPAGNVASIRDDAQQTIYFDNQVVEPHDDYTYDSIYRLIEATGREHRGQADVPWTSWSDEFRINPPDPRNGRAMRRYTERYEYDEVGCILALRHEADAGNWSRTYAYEEASLLEPAKRSNRLSSTTVGGMAEPYRHDAHGNMTRMSHLADMVWDFEDQLQMVDLGGGGKAHYVYDSAGQRMRKVIERQNGTRQKERIYLGVFETYREYNGRGEAVALERETLHVMDDRQRIALVESRTSGDDGSPRQLPRFQLNDHLGSCVLELDQQAETISYEENYPYGGTSYQAVRNQLEARKRFRFTGKERDEESGFYYFGARHYVPWLGRWLRCDPLGLNDGSNLYIFAANNPTSLRDLSGLQSSRLPFSEDIERFVEDEWWTEANPPTASAEHDRTAEEEDEEQNGCGLRPECVPTSRGVKRLPFDSFVVGPLKLTNIRAIRRGTDIRVSVGDLDYGWKGDDLWVKANVDVRGRATIASDVEARAFGLRGTSRLSTTALNGTWRANEGRLTGNILADLSLSSKAVVFQLDSYRISLGTMGVNAQLYAEAETTLDQELNIQKAERFLKGSFRINAEAAFGPIVLARMIGSGKFTASTFSIEGRLEVNLLPIAYGRGQWRANSVQGFGASGEAFGPIALGVSLTPKAITGADDASWSVKAPIMAFQPSLLGAGYSNFSIGPKLSTYFAIGLTPTSSYSEYYQSGLVRPTSTNLGPYFGAVFSARF